MFPWQFYNHLQDYRLSQHRIPQSPYFYSAVNFFSQSFFLPYLLTFFVPPVLSRAIFLFHVCLSLLQSPVEKKFCTYTPARTTQPVTLLTRSALLPCKQVTYTPCLLHMKCHFVCVHNDYSTQRCIVSRTNSTTVGYS